MIKKKRLKYRKKHEKQEKSLFSKKSNNLDILLAHYPPYGYFDKVDYPGENPMNGKHVGFKPYTKYIKKFKPKLFICGHMHEYQGVKKLDDTLILTTGAAKEGKAAVLEYDDNKKIKIKLIN